MRWLFDALAIIGFIRIAWFLAPWVCVVIVASWLGSLWWLVPVAFALIFLVGFLRGRRS
jgi:hypothetical protein